MQLVFQLCKKNAPTPTHAHRLYVLPHCKSCLYSNIYTHTCKHKPCAFLFLFLFSQTDSDSGCKMKLGLQLRHPVHSGRLAQNASTARGKSHKKPPPPSNSPSSWLQQLFTLPCVCIFAYGTQLPPYCVCGMNYKCCCVTHSMQPCFLGRERQQERERDQSMNRVCWPSWTS